MEVVNGQPYVRHLVTDAPAPDGLFAVSCLCRWTASAAWQQALDKLENRHVDGALGLPEKELKKL